MGLAYITPIGSNPEQVEYRLGEGHGCGGHGKTDRQFSYHADGRERPLRWIGRALTDLGIVAGSELTEDQFDLARALMRGEHPRTGEVLVEAKRGVSDDAKVPLAPLVRAVEAVAAEAAVSTEDVLGGRVKLVEAFAAAERAVIGRGEAARLRADEAGKIADAAGLDVEQVWGEQVYERAAANLWEIRRVRNAEGTLAEERVPRRTLVGNMGYDVTFTLPKSLSMVLAFADEDTAAAVERIYTEQVAATFGWLEDTTAYGMRGKHGGGRSAEVVTGNGFAGWVMVHRAARPVEGAEIGDPHWHVHATVANMTRGPDGKWSTVAAGGRDLMRHAAAVDHILKATVRHELSRRFGIVFSRNLRTKAWEVAGIPDETLRQFSKRHADIKAMLTQLGYDETTASRAQDRIAEQRSRGRKGEAIAAPDATLQHIWRSEELDAGRDPAEHMRRVFNTDAEGAARGGADAGTPGPGGSPTSPTGSGETGGASGDLDDDEVEALAHAPALRGPTDLTGLGTAQYAAAAGASSAGPDPDVVAWVAEELLDPDTGLTAHSRRFSRAMAIARVADAMPAGFATPAAVEAMTDAVLGHRGFVKIPDKSADDDGKSGVATSVQGPNGATRRLDAGHMCNAAAWTTDDVVAVEMVVLRAARASDAEQSPTRVIDAELIGLALDVVGAQLDHPLSAEQHAALIRVVSSGRMIDTINGAPGTGKTTLMRAVRVVFETAGFVVGGAATAGVAAQNLETESAIPSRTVAFYASRIRRGNLEVLRGVDVLVLDEANLTEDRDRAALYRAAAVSGTRIVEVGDGKQLRGVGVGSLFARVHEIIDGAELVENRRQVDEDEREAIAAWRESRYAEALSIWDGTAQMVATETGREAATAMLARWWEQRRGAASAHHEMRGLLMLAATNEQVRRLNAAAQALRLAEGELGAGWTYDVAGGERLQVHVGDHVLLRRNDRQHTHTSGDVVLNGYRAMVTNIDAHGTLGVEWEQDGPDGTVETRSAQLSTTYIGIGGVTLGYGMTVHKSEGLTVKKQWTTPEGEESRGVVLFHAAGADNPAMHVATSRHRGEVVLFAGRDELDTIQDSYLHGVPRTRGERTERVIEKLAERARATEAHPDDRPVVADLGIEEFRSEDGREQVARATRAAAQAETERHRQAQRADWADRARARVEYRAQRAHEEQERRDADRRRRESAAALLREVWRHEPALVETIIAAAAFSTVARNLHDAAEAGYDPREVLAEIGLGEVGADRVRDAAAFTAYMVDLAVAHLHHDNAARAADSTVETDAAGPGPRSAAARALEFERMREQAADLIREVWSTRPALAEAVIAAPAFDAVVRVLDHYAPTEGRAGLDVRGLLASVPLAKLDAPDVEDRAAFSAYVLRRVADAQLDAIDDARDRAEHEAEQNVRHDGAAAVLRSAWSAHPDLADRVITGSAFAFLAQHMQTAQEAGHDVEAALARIDPEALTAPHVTNPSGAAVYAFRREVDPAPAVQAPTPEDLSSIGSSEPAASEPPHPHEIDPADDAHAALSAEPELGFRQQTAGAPEPALTGPEVGVPESDISVPVEPRAVPEVGADRVPHWTRRAHGALTDGELHELVESEQRRATRIAGDRETAEQHAEQLRVQVQSEQGRDVLAVEANLAQLREQARAIAAAAQLETRWNTTVEHLGRIAEERGRTEDELAGLPGRARARHAELTQHLEQLQAAEENAEHAAGDLARQQAPLHELSGPPDQRRHVLTRAAAAERDHPHAREAAQRRDMATAEAAHRRVARLVEQEQQHAEGLVSLQVEQQLREQLPHHDLALEGIERADTLQLAHAAEPGRHAAGPELSGPQPAIPEQTGPEHAPHTIEQTEPPPEREP